MKLKGNDTRMVELYHNLSSLRGDYIGDHLGEYKRGIEGDTMSFRLWLSWHIDYPACT